ncbi:hypothetical protein ACQ86B_17360 [Mycolicibacterium aichiense]|uniref:hypothetical protein n=1 Tax=Mycolicibacterium aichiense TaxID=1799 RepID=UPI003D67802A
MALAELAPERQARTVVGAPGMNHRIPVKLLIQLFSQLRDRPFLTATQYRAAGPAGIGVYFVERSDQVGTLAIHGGIARFDP